MELRTGLLSLLFFFSVFTNDHVFAASDCYCMLDGVTSLTRWHEMSDECPFRMDCSFFLRFASGNGSDNFSVTAYGKVPEDSDRHFEVLITAADSDGESPKVLIFDFMMNRLHREHVRYAEYKFRNSLVEQQNVKVISVCEHTTDDYEIQAVCQFTSQFDIRKHPVFVQVNDHHQIHHHLKWYLPGKDNKFDYVTQSGTATRVVLFSNGSETLTTPAPTTTTTTTEASVTSTSKPVVRDTGGEEPDTRLLFRLIWIQSFLLIILAVVYALILRVWWQARTRRRRREERKRRRSGSPVNQKKRSVSPKRRATASFESDAN